MAEIWHCPPWEVAAAPAFWVRRAWLYHSSKNEAEVTKAKNEEALRKAYGS